jgi:hypothetical protein
MVLGRELLSPKCLYVDVTAATAASIFPSSSSKLDFLRASAVLTVMMS